MSEHTPKHTGCPPHVVQYIANGDKRFKSIAYQGPRGARGIRFCALVALDGINGQQPRPRCTTECYYASAMQDSEVSPVQAQLPESGP